MAEPDYILDLQSLKPATGEAEQHADNGEPTLPKGPIGRKWLAMSFRCCHAYGRIYLKPDGSAYSGFCPKCGKPIRIRVGEGGTSCRFFSVE